VFVNENTAATGSGVASSYTDSASKGNFHSGNQLTLMLSLVMLALLSAAVWLLVRAVSRNEHAVENEVNYQKLNLEQIFGRIMKQ
jgi:hypothetical protein